MHDRSSHIVVYHNAHAEGPHPGNTDSQQHDHAGRKPELETNGVAGDTPALFASRAQQAECRDPDVPEHRQEKVEKTPGSGAEVNKRCKADIHAAPRLMYMPNHIGVVA
jgi:hypothetical protein